MKTIKEIREILSRAFAIINQNQTTGEREETIVDGHVVVNGSAFIADYEIERIIQALKK